MAIRRALLTAAALSGVLLVAGCASGSDDAALLDDPDLLAALEEDAQGVAESLGVTDPPEVQPVRVIRLEEWAPTQIECLRDAGYDVGLTEDGEGIAFPEIDDPALAASLAEARYVCEVEYPVDPIYYEPLSTAQLKELYSYRVGDLIACLEDNGYSVDVAPPSETLFVESGGEWSPYAELSIASSDLAEISRTCPQVPSTLYGTN